MKSWLCKDFAGEFYLTRDHWDACAAKEDGRFCLDLEADLHLYLASEVECTVCGGRAMACAVLGHRPPTDKTVWKHPPAAAVDTAADAADTDGGPLP